MAIVGTTGVALSFLPMVIDVIYIESRREAHITLRGVGRHLKRLRNAARRIGYLLLVVR